MMSLINLLLDTWFYVTINCIFLHSLKLWCLGCAVNWTHYPSTSVANLIRTASLLTLQECKQACLSAMNCSGFDFHLYYQKGQCWLDGSGSTGPKHPRLGSDHYDLVTTCPRTYTQNVILV